MKKVFQTLIVSTFAVGGAFSLTGCGVDAPEGPEAAEADSEEEDESLAEESENSEGE